MKRWAIGLALATVALCATPARADDTSCQDICIDGCANACSSVCRAEHTRESCEILCNPACYSACEPRCTTPSCGDACISTCAARCAEDGASADCPNRCATRCGRLCDDGVSVASADELTTERRHGGHEPLDNSGWCPGQVATPEERSASTSNREREVDPDAPGTVATCDYTGGPANAPPLLAALGLATALTASRRRAAKRR